MTTSTIYIIAISILAIALGRMIYLWWWQKTDNIALRESVSYWQQELDMALDVTSAVSERLNTNKGLNNAQVKEIHAKLKGLDRRVEG